jgi:cytochrome o ubiquinol oxidase subunit III
VNTPATALGLSVTPPALDLGAAAAPDYRGATGYGEGGPSPKRVVVGYGFWIFLLSDIVMFSAFFASYAVLSGATAGGPVAAQLFDLHSLAIQTGCLLFSSFCCGMASLAVEACRPTLTQIALLATGLLGLTFLVLEIHEFARLIAQGAGPSRSAFLSSFFALVGCHGAHISAGLLWLGTTMAQFYAKGFRADIRRRYLCFSLFWHALDIIWVAIFSLVYLTGAHT